MHEVSALTKSPAGPAAVLLYGIVFLFALTYFLGAPWLRAYTLTLYAGVSAWAAAVALQRFRVRRLAPNRIDILFAAFFTSILVSAAMNWWEGTLAHLKLMPVFFLLPYVLGRMTLADDGYMLRNWVMAMGALLMLMIIPEYLNVLTHGLPYVNSPAPVLFGQGHGVMLSGLLLSATFLGLVSILLSPDEPHSPSFLASRKGRYFGYALVMLIVVTIGWISSRGSILAGAAGGAILFLVSPRSSRRRKLEILVAVSIALAIAVGNARQRDANAEFYAQLLQAPVTADAGPVDRTGAPRGAEPKSSILGAKACGQIIDSVSDRWVHYQQALALFLTKPLLGVGANHYGFYACTGPGSFPHSTLLQVFAELGGMVGIAYCVLIWFTLRALMQSVRRCAAPAGAPVWSWFLAFGTMQVIVAQLNGDYFISAAVYFVMGVAASSLDESIATGRMR